MHYSDGVKKMALEPQLISLITEQGCASGNKKHPTYIMSVPETISP